MPDKFSKSFIQALENKDTESLLTIPKSDLHNHLGRGCRRQWLSEKLNHDFPPPPEKFEGKVVFIHIPTLKYIDENFISKIKELELWHLGWYI